ncbi:hypothetical protein Acr_23g0012170 [Actinidia rufa]|uniref:Uncharacterized protein n=1 Tax=Actinidia rufa TaxID=165716 RepID=A0A7J0GPW2_9ERIC|nr:hypothetical protein Acr_23g0012170 [Actinidia rufa]
MDIDGPLDFESEDLLLKPPTPSKKRKKIIGLDDLVNDYLKENKKLELKAKRTKARKNYYSDDEEESVEAKLSECMGQISGEDEIYLWGLQTFGDQKTRPSLGFTELGSCKLLQFFMDNELNSVVELDIEKGEVFLERLLVNGWLLKLVNASGHVEKSIATWAFGLMLYSSKEALSASACDFWTAILSPIIEIKIDWLPSYSEIKGALEIYGFQSTLSSIVSSHVETVNADSDCGGPPHNIRAWIKYVASCIQVRVPRDMNSLRTVESISGLDARGKHLRRAVAFHILVACLDNKAIDAETILRILISINVKDKSCDLFKTYMYLVLTENWLSSNPMLEDKSVIYKLWGVYLRNCSCQITGTDLRSYASKVRSKASYLLQGTNNQ